MRLMTGKHLFQSNTYHRTNTDNDVDSPNCKLCTNFSCETVSHMLFTCPKFSNQRTYMWENVKLLCPKQLFLTMNDMHANDKTVFILSGFKCQYVQEWSDLYGAVLRYVTTLYEERLKYMI